METVKERLDERRRRVMELWGKGLEKVEEDRAKKTFLQHKRDSDGNSTSSRSRVINVTEREVSRSSAHTMV
jgi:hypothetical protein